MSHDLIEKYMKFPIRIKNGYYTTQFGGISEEVLLKDPFSEAILPCIGINQNNLELQGIAPYSLCVVTGPRFEILLPVLPLNELTPHALALSPNGQGVLPEEGESIYRRVHEGDSLILNFTCYRS